MAAASADRPRDCIEVKDLLVRGIVGLNDEERAKRQDILINLTLRTDVRATAAADALGESGVNYRTVTKQIIRLVESSSYFTVEKLATEIARITLEPAAVSEVSVTVEKPGALRFARSVGVTVVRCRKDFI